jgi:hypothetical protein
MENLDILKKLILQEEEQDDKERMETSPKTFEDDPMNFILTKYDGLKEIMSELMSEDFEELLTGVYILAYKPTQLKIVLHNGQYFFMTFMGEAYQATVSGKNYFLLNVGEKQRAMMAISRLLRWGSPLKVKGPEGAEQDATASDTTGAEETPPAEGSETTSGEEGETLEENKNMRQTDILKLLLEMEVSGQDAETLGVELWNMSLNNKKIPAEYAKYESVFKELQKYSKKYKVEIEKYSGQRIATTKFWEEETGKTKDEPKTDLISKDKKKLRLSAKKGPAQLMSGVKAESKATVLAAARSVGLDAEIKTRLMKEINKLADTTKTDKLNTAELRKTDIKNIKSKINIEAKKVLDSAIKANAVLQKDLNDLFNKNANFKKAFVYEAMTGREKFGVGSPAEANFVIAFSNDFNHVKFEDISSMSSPIVSNIADKTKLNVSFKSTSRKQKGEKVGYNFFSTIRLGLEDLVAKQDKLSEVLDSNNLNEIDIMGKIKDFILYLQNKFNNIIDYISKGYEKIKELIKEGIASVLDFLGFDIDVDFNNEIDFYNSMK